MKQQILFKDLGKEHSYKEIWDLQESLLQENVRLKSEKKTEERSQETGDERENKGDRSRNIEDRSGRREDRSQNIEDRSGKREDRSRNIEDRSGRREDRSQNIEDRSQVPTSSSQLTTYNLQLTTNNHLLFAEHTPVYTLGKSGDIKHVLIDEKERQEKGVEFFKINRGGDITFHGPGQLVGYPILDLDNFKTDLGWYLRNLEEVIILTMAEYGLEGERSKGETGVWVDPDIKGKERKICAMGIRCSRWITMHGFAFNINTDLNYFNYIIPCGIQNKQVTSMQKELGCEVPMAALKQKVKDNFAKVFNADIKEF